MWSDGVWRNSIYDVECCVKDQCCGWCVEDGVLRMVC